MPENLTISLPFAKNGESKTDVFKDKTVRKVFDHGEWWFSVKDILEAAKRGGQIAGTARIQIEQATKERVVTKTNYLSERQRKSTTLADGFNEVVKKIVEEKKPKNKGK